MANGRPTKAQIEAAVTQAYLLPLAVQIPIIANNLIIIGLTDTFALAERALNYVDRNIRPESVWRGLMADYILTQIQRSVVPGDPGTHFSGPPLPPAAVLERAWNRDPNKPQAIFNSIQSARYIFPLSIVQEAVQRVRSSGVPIGSEASFFSQEARRIFLARQTLQEVLLVPFDPAQFAQRWADRTRNEWPFIVSQVQRVTESPTDKAADARTKWVSRMTDQATHNRWESGLRSVSLQEWQASFDPQLDSAFRVSVDNARGKMQEFGQWLSTNIDQARAAAESAVPQVLTINDAAEKAAAYIRAWENRRFKGQ